ncbi:unnamed protein product [Urochloa humidicola]
MASSPITKSTSTTETLRGELVTRLSWTTAAPAIAEPPPPDLREHLGALLRTPQVGADVTFAVQGETFRAHRAVLAARSPVFKAELSVSPAAAKGGNAGEMMAIDGMTPLVFETLLHFIYTDALPDMDDLGREEYQEFVRNLLAAADRYEMYRLKQICRVILEKGLDAKTVAAELDSAGQRHHCQALGDGCVQLMPMTSPGLEG